MALRDRLQNQVVGIVILSYSIAWARASVRLFRVCVPHGTFGDMNGEYRSPGSAIGATRTRRVPTETTCELR